MIYTHRLTLDLNGRQRKQFVEVKQFDENSHKFIITVKMDGEDVTITDDLTYKMRIVKQDKTWCLYDAELDTDGNIVAIPGNQAFTVKGLALADIEIKEGEELLSTAYFFLDVGPSGVGEHLSSTSEYKKLQDLIIEAERIVGGSYGYYIPSFTSDGVIHFTKSRDEMPDLPDVHAVTFADENSDGNIVITLGDPDTSGS